MRKTVQTVLTLMGVLLSAAGAWAQSGQPGYSFLTSSQKPATGPAVVTPTATSPPEPGAIGAVPGYAPIQAGPGMGGPGAMPGSMGMPMGGPPMTFDPYAGGYPGGFGPGLPPDPVSTFGTERIWVSGSYLLGYLTRPHLAAPLVTTGSAADLHPGALGQPGTQILFGDQQYQYGPLSGVQVDLGVNLNDRLYLEGTVMYFGPQHTTAFYTSDANGSPFIGRPVFNTLFGQDRSYLTSSPGLVAGTTSVESRLQLYSIEANARYQVNMTPYLNLDFLLGYRYMRLDEDLNINDNLVPIAGSITFLGNSITAPNTVSDSDHFSTTNRFNGVNTGMRLRWQSGFDWLAFTGYGKLAIGATQQTVDIQGTSASGGLVANGGILALSSNIGTHERTVFGAIPEGGASFVLNLTRGVRFHAGYSATYWNNVVRAGDQIDHRVNPALVPTDVNFGSGNPGANPAFTFRSRALWLNTLNFGFDFYY